MIVSISDKKHSIKKPILRLPWWLIGKESTCECSRHRFDPWSRKIPHAAEHVTPCAAATECVLQSPGVAVPEACAA